MASENPQSRLLLSGLVPLLAGLGLAALSGAVMKGLADELPTFLIVWCRFLGFALLMLPIALWRSGWAKTFSPIMPVAQMARGVMLLLGSASFIIGTRSLDFAEAITLLYIYPFLITLFAPFFLGEPPRVLTFVGVVGGFIGVLLVARPSWDGLANAGTPFALFAGALIAGQMILNRRLGGVSDPLLTSFWGACIATILLTPAVPWILQPITTTQIGLLLLLALMASVSQTLVTIAFARSPAADLAPFSYSEIVAAVGIGYVFFGTLPDGLSFLGIAIIIASGVMVARIQRGRVTFRRQPKI